MNIQPMALRSTLPVYDSYDKNDEIEQFRKVLPAANETKGRSITNILYDRSIKGLRGCGGLKRECPYQEVDHYDGLCHPSPSSVIREDEKEIPFLLSDYLSTINPQVNDPVKSLEMPQATKDTSSNHLPTTLPSRLKINAYPTSYINELRYFAERQSITNYNWNYLSLKPSSDDDRHIQADIPRRLLHQTSNQTNAISTISISFSPDSRTVASTHGDHSVKITCCHSGALIRNLVGHPRTPWTVKYHPTQSNIVASGCLGFQVRIWDWNHKDPSSTSNANANRNHTSYYQDDDNEGYERTENDRLYDYHDGQGICLRMIRLQYAIISLSFHPSGSILAVASGQSLHLLSLWDQNKTNSNSSAEQHPALPGPHTTELRYEHNLRCVHFPPSGNTIIIGGVNPTPPSPYVYNQPNQQDTSYSLRVWDFDLEAALNPHIYVGAEGQYHEQQYGMLGRPRMRRDAMSNCRTLVPRAVLYNDGGFDVSPDGKTLCGCAEYWLPHGIDSAAELLETEYRESNSSNNESNENEESKSSSTDHQDQDEDLEAVEDLRESVPSAEDGGDERPNPNSYNSPTERSLQQRRLECMTPPASARLNIPTTPPSPPGRRFQTRRNEILRHRGRSRFPVPLGNSPHIMTHQSHHAAILRKEHASLGMEAGRYVPHVVVVSLDGSYGRFGQLLEAVPLGSKALSVTCVKFSPTAEYCLLGYGVRENVSNLNSDSREGEAGARHNHHPVTAFYSIRGGLTHVATMLSDHDDVNIARFHPDSGYGLVYGTKQGRVRVLSPRPWNCYYN